MIATIYPLSGLDGDEEKSVLVLVNGPVSLCSPSVYIVIVVVAVLVVVAVILVMFVCVCFLQYILPLFCNNSLRIHGDTRPYTAVYRGKEPSADP